MPPRVAVAYLTDYDMRLAMLFLAGSDLWPNTPQPPLEALGTGSMKAAFNGVPSLSMADGSGAKETEKFGGSSYFAKM